MFRVHSKRQQHMTIFAISSSEIRQQPNLQSF
jgi:hypothetical protein